MDRTPDQESSEPGWASGRRDWFGEPYQDPNAEKLAALTPSALASPVRRALGSDTVEVNGWEVELVKGRGGDSMEGLGVYRLSGGGRDRGRDVQWSMMLKIVRPAENEMTSHAGTREVLAYQSGFLHDLPGGLAAPRCFGILEQEDGAFWMWIEEIVDEVGDEWPVERYGLAARHLGQLNGTYLAGRPLPDFAWLSRKWLRKYTSQYATSVGELDGNLAHPLMRRICPPDVANALIRLWAQREPLLDALERLPQTFCHMDAFRHNLFARRGAGGREETVAIDWPYAGIGAVGEELAPLVSMGFGRFEISCAELRELDEVLFKGYLAGLRDAGWNGDPRVARFGYVASAPLRYAFMGTRLVQFLRSMDEERRAQMEQRMKAGFEKHGPAFAELQRFLLDLADEALGLLDSLEIP